MFHYHLKQTAKTSMIMLVFGAGLFALANFSIPTRANEVPEDNQIKQYPKLPEITSKNQISAQSDGVSTINTANPPGNLKNFLVSSVVDGSTIIVEGTTRVRLAGIKSPDKDEEYGLEATDFLSSMILGKEVLIMPDSLNPKDDFGRIRAVLFLERKNINTEMVKAGLAHTFPVTPSIIEIGDWEIFEKEARDAKRGLWGGIKYYNNLVEEVEEIPAL